MKTKKRAFSLKLFLALLAIVLSLTLTACFSDDDEEEATTTTTTTTAGTTAAAISVTSSSDSINPGETTDIYATVYNSSGEGIADIEVIFSLDKPTLASIPSTVTTSSSGVATATLTARDLSGEVQVTATKGDISSDPIKIVISEGLEETLPNEINLTVNPTSILVAGTSTVTAQVLDADGNAVPNGTTVTFKLKNDEYYGSISPTSITNGGSATATFEASTNPGTETINVSSGSATASIDIDIQQAPATSIEFLSAEPQAIAIAESGGNETSTIKFIVKNSNGDPLSDVSVSFTMAGPNGGEYIDPSDDGTPDEIVVSTDSSEDSKGIAQVILHSGYVAGPVTISATIDVDGTLMTVQSSVVSIGGGVPNEKWFSISASVLNLPGLNYNNKTSEITAYLADRFGNYNVLTGTTVSFASEVGLAIDTSNVTTDENGLATVTVRTQQSISADSPEDVAAETWETQLQTYVLNTYGATFTSNPRDGLCALLVYTKGEEHFIDSNANGTYDSSDAFVDTFDDPFCDYNDNGQYDDSTSTDPEEIYLDSADPPDGDWDGVNGIWDANKYIFGNFQILVTGQPIILSDVTTFTVPSGGSDYIMVLVCDQNLNQLTPGSKVTISTDVGSIAGNVEREYADSNAVGPTRDAHRSLIEYAIEIYDADPTDTDLPERATISIEVEWEGSKYILQITGTVD